jgi:hypothetical protein
LTVQSLGHSTIDDTGNVQGNLVITRYFTPTLDSLLNNPFATIPPPPADANDANYDYVLTAHVNASSHVTYSWVLQGGQ